MLKEGSVKLQLRRRLTLGAASLAIISLTAGPVLAASPTVPTGDKGDVAGSGATFPTLLYRSWMATFSRSYPATFDPSGDKAKGLVMSYNAVGSGAGKRNFYGSDARKPAQLFSGTDALLTDAEKASIGTSVGDYSMIPVALGPVAVVYNLPNLRQKISATSKTTRAATLYLDGPTLGKIYAGQISRWNDAAIKALNPLIVNLPSTFIKPVYRSDGSGTSFIFSTYLLKVSPTWKTALGGKPSQTMADKISTLPSKARAVGSPGNEGVASTVAEVRNSIGYVELGYALQLGLKYAWMRTGDTLKKYFVPPTTSGAQAAAAAAFRAGTADDPVNPGTVDSGQFLQPVNQKGATSYAISGYTWVLLYGDYKGANDPGLAKAQANVAFWEWALRASGGQARMSRLGYGPLPTSVAREATAELHKIRYDGSAIWP
jgi:phosphate transport system substrate-binding protein